MPIVTAVAAATLAAAGITSTFIDEAEIVEIDEGSAAAAIRIEYPFIGRLFRFWVSPVGWRTTVLFAIKCMSHPIQQAFAPLGV
ncbi:hypothetical protein ABIC01_000938 [Bradyrhizobium sp. RT4b]